MAQIGKEVREIYVEPLELPAPVRPVETPTPEIVPAETPALEPVAV